MQFIKIVENKIKRPLLSILSSSIYSLLNIQHI